jgi:hypothetical protein
LALNRERLTITDGNTVRLDAVNDATHVNVDGDAMTGPLSIESEATSLTVTSDPTDALPTFRHAIKAEMRGVSGAAVQGEATNAEGGGIAVFGRTFAPQGTAVLATASSTTGNSRAITASSVSSEGVTMELFHNASGPNTATMVVRKSGVEGVIAKFDHNFNTRYTIELSGDATLSGTHFAEDHVNTSDARLKEHVTSVDGVLPRLERIRSVRYRFSDQGEGPSDYRLGLLAQEVEAEFPELVQEGSDGYLAVSYGHLAAVLLQAIKEQQQQIEALEQQVDVLSGTGAELPVAD